MPARRCAIWRRTMVWAPGEARLGAFEVERRNVDFRYEADPEGPQQTCNRCHSMGRVLNQRRTLEEWELLTRDAPRLLPAGPTSSRFWWATGLGGPGPEGRRGRRWPDGRRTRGGPSGRGVPARFGGMGELVGQHAGAAAGGHLGAGSGKRAGDRDRCTAKSSWRRVPRAPDALETRARYTYPARRRGRHSRTGQALVYTGYQWRGRSTSPGHFSAREVMFVSRDPRRDQRGAGSHRRLRRARHRRDAAPGRGPEPMITGVYPPAVPVAAGGGDPAVVRPPTCRTGSTRRPSILGAGLTVTGVSDRSSTAAATLQVTVAPRRAGRQPAISSSAGPR